MITELVEMKISCFLLTGITHLLWGICGWYSLKCNLLCRVSEDSQIISKFTFPLLVYSKRGNITALFYLLLLLGFRSLRELFCSSLKVHCPLSSAGMFFPLGCFSLLSSSSLLPHTISGVGKVPQHLSGGQPALQTKTALNSQVGDCYGRTGAVCEAGQ